MFKYEYNSKDIHVQMEGKLKQVVSNARGISDINNHPVLIRDSYAGILIQNDAKKWLYVVPPNIPIDYMNECLGMFTAIIDKQHVSIIINHSEYEECFYEYINKIILSIDSYFAKLRISKDQQSINTYYVESQLPEEHKLTGLEQKSINTHYVKSQLPEEHKLTGSELKSIKISDKLKQELYKHSVKMSHVAWIMECRNKNCEYDNCYFYHDDGEQLPFTIGINIQNVRYCKYGTRCKRRYKIGCRYNHNTNWMWNSYYETLINELCELYKTFPEEYRKKTFPEEYRKNGWPKFECT